MLCINLWGSWVQDQHDKSVTLSLYIYKQKSSNHRGKKILLIFLWGTCSLPAHDFELFWNKADNVRNPSPRHPLSASGYSLQRVLGCTPWHWVKKTHPKHGLLASTSLGCPCLPEVKCGSTSYTWGKIKRNASSHQLEQIFICVLALNKNFKIMLLHWEKDKNTGSIGCTNVIHDVLSACSYYLYFHFTFIVALV